MRRDDQLAMIRRLFDHIEQGTTTYADAPHRNPVRNYTCRERLAAERATLFGDYPLLIGMGARIGRPGDYMVEDIAGRSTLIVRDRAGRARAFRNVCRHRGAPVAEGCGNARRFSCPYHAWTYGLDGALQVIPDQESFAGVDKTAHGLVEVPASEKYGLLFVRPEGTDAIEIDGHLSGLERDLAAYGFESFHHYRSITIRRRMNWKLSPETFMEGYHLQYLHRDSVGPIFFSNLMAFDAFGPHSRLTLPRRRIMELKAREEAGWDLIPETAVIYTFFPNVTFVVQAGHIEMWRSYPAGDDPSAARIELSVYTPQAVETEKAKAFYEKNIDLAIKAVDNEDFPLSEGIQAGHLAAMQEAVTYGRNEPALTHYSTALDKALGAG